MTTTLGKIAFVALSFALPLTLAAGAPPPAASDEADTSTGATRVLRWQGGRQAAMSVTLDDQLESQRRIAVPELEERHLKATFIINPGNERFTTGMKAFWQEKLPTLGHEYGVHTMLHKATDDTVDADLAQCVEVLRKVNPNSTPLMTFAMPGGKDASGTPVWNVSKEKGEAALAKNHLVTRDTKLYMYLPGKTLDDLKKWVDQVIASGGFEKICLHGVGGDYIAIPTDVFTGYLDYLVAKQDVLWVAPHIVVAKYAEEFKTAKATGKAVGETIEVTLTSEADPALYDQPLTLETRVPKDWTACQVVQGKAASEAKVTDDLVRYDARPGSDTVVLRKAVTGQ